MKSLIRLTALVLTLMLVLTGTAFAQDLDKYKMDEPIKVTVMKRQGVITYAPDESVTKNIYFDAYRDHLGIEVDYTVLATGDEYAQKLTMAMASNNLADIMFLPIEQYSQLAKAGKLWDMGPVLEEYASDLTKQCMNSDGGVILDAAKVDGVLYGIPTGNAEQIPCNFLWIRKDWLNKLNLDVPKNLDDVIAIARAFKNDDPDGNGQNDTWGLGINKAMSETSGFGTIEGFLNAFGGSIMYQAWLENEDGTMSYVPASQGTRAGLEKLAELFKEGLINEEFGVTDADGVGEAVAAGKCGLFYGGDGISWGYGRDAMANNPEAAWICLNALTEDGQVADAYSFKSLSYIWAVNKDFAHPEALIKFVNFNNDRINSPEATLESLAVWGVNPTTGINQCDYTLALVDPYLNKAIGYNTTIGQVFKGELKAEDLMPEAYRYYEGIKRYVDEGWPETMRANPDDLTAFQYAMCWGPEFGSWTRYQELRGAGKIKISAFYGSPTPTMAKKWSTLMSLQEETFTKIIAGSQSIEAFDAFVAQWKSLGGDTISAEIQTAFGKK